MPSVILLQPDPRVAERLRAQIESASGYQVVASVSDVAHAAEAVRRLEAAIVVTDLQLPGGPVAVSLWRLRGARVVVIATSAEDPRLMDALFSGADAFFAPGHSPSLLAVIDQALHGEATIAPQIARRVIEEFERSPWVDSEHDDHVDDPDDPLRLSETEWLLLHWTAEGFLPGEIARGLRQTVHGVGVRIRMIYRKLQHRMQAGAALAARA